jgi:hypothetical protein
VFQYITFTNMIIILLIPVYVYVLAYCVGYGFYKGKFYWKRDHWYFLDVMKQCESEEEICDQFSKEELEKVID